MHICYLLANCYSYYSSAIPALAEVLTTCPMDRLAALASVAKQETAFGPVSLWDASVCMENGIVIGQLASHALSLHVE